MDNNFWDQIEFEVEIDMISERAVDLARYNDYREEDVLPECDQIYRQVICNQKITEQDPEVPVTKGTSRHGNRAERRKATRRANRRKQEKAAYSYNIIDRHGKVKDTGMREYFRGAKNYTRKSRYAGKNLIPEEYTPEAYYVVSPGEYDMRYFHEVYDLLIFMAKNGYDYAIVDGTVFDTTQITQILKDLGEESEMERAYWDDEDAYDDPQPYEIDLYKEFIEEFNLGKLFETWKAERGY